jgi:hypothetical protein
MTLRVTLGPRLRGDDKEMSDVLLSARNISVRFGPEMKFGPQKRLGDELSRMSQIQDGRWKVVSDCVKP